MNLHRRHGMPVYLTADERAIESAAATAPVATVLKKSLRFITVPR